MGIVFLKSIPIARSVQMEETHESMDHFLSAVNYQEDKWLISGDLKVAILVLGRKDEYSLFSVSLEQPGWRPTLCQTRETVKD